MILRNYAAGDTSTLANLFTRSVHGLTVNQYSARQRHAWAPTPPDTHAWHEHFATLQTLIAVADEAPLGFISFKADGYIDLLYTAPEAARQGVASKLLENAWKRLASRRKLHALRTNASLAAIPFFQRHGFEIAATESVTRRGQQLARASMLKATH